eukprot:scaffold1343_cov369-Prasinococcus_capsulatus_cf.AAC.4
MALILAYAARLGCARRQALHALGHAVFPQLHTSIQRADGDVLAVGRHLYEGDRWGLVRIGKSFEACARIAVPYAADAIIAARHDQAAFLVKLDSGHRVRVRRQRAQTTTVAHVPCLHGLIV